MLECMYERVFFVVHYRRYPVERTIYVQTTGRLLPRRISQLLQELGYKVWINPKQGNDVDLKTWYENELILVSEILNWSIGSKISKKRLRKMISNMKKYNCKKLLIYTILDEESLSKFRENGIDTIQIGYQLLPKCYHNFFDSKDQIERRKTDSKETRLDLKKKITAYLKRNGFHI